jgi:hypothetical protein
MNLQNAGTYNVLSRAEAAASGLSRFYTGRECRSGHAAERFVSNRQCVACNAVYTRQRERLRSFADPTYRVFRNVLRRTGQALRGKASPSHGLGCDRECLTRHIERQFRVGMSWHCYRQWEVDHVIPLSAAASLDRLLDLCHYSNLQPLWRRENQMKGGA